MYPLAYKEEMHNKIRGNMALGNNKQNRPRHAISIFQSVIGV